MLTCRAFSIGLVYVLMLPTTHGASSQGRAGRLWGSCTGAAPHADN